jgi:thiol-disulfide isomerase/thioredoxin
LTAERNDETRGARLKDSRWKRKLFLLALCLGLLVIAANSLGLFSLAPRNPGKIECLGKEELSAPVFSLADLKGEKVDLVSFQGQVIIIDFWATWCGPCREEIPRLNQISQKYRDQGVVVIGISLDRKDPVEVKKFLDSLQVGYLNLIGGEEVFEKYGQVANWGPIRGIPATFVIDRKGVICQRFLGLTETRVLEEALRAVL